MVRTCGQHWEVGALHPKRPIEWAFDREKNYAVSTLIGWCVFSGFSACLWLHPQCCPSSRLVPIKVMKWNEIIFSSVPRLVWKAFTLVSELSDLRWKVEFWTLEIDVATAYICRQSSGITVSMTIGRKFRSKNRHDRSAPLTGALNGAVIQRSCFWILFRTFHQC